MSYRTFHSLGLLLASLAVFHAAGLPACADVFNLASGGRIEGQIVEQPGGDQAKCVIELTSGGQVTIARSQITRIETTSETDAEYQKLARTSPDTVDGHVRMAEWCREHKLTTQAKAHMARVLEIDSEHADARNAAGFRQQGGKWMTRDDIMASRGLVMHEGRYVTPQHVELLKSQKSAKESEGNWTKQIDLLRRWLTGRREDRAAQAHADLLKITDPAAADAVVNMLKREKNPQLKKLWIEVASHIDSRATIDALVDRSLADPDEDIRIQSLEGLIKSGRQGLAAPYIRALSNRDNDIVNRAGKALGMIGDRDALGPLIEAIITTHKVKVSDANPDQHSYAFETSGGGGFSFGGGGPKAIDRDFRNPAVLTALITLADGASFDYDKQAWRQWLAAQTKNRRIDVRRDK